MAIDIEFDVQDAFALVRPQWKIAGTLEDAGNAFATACKEQYQANAPDRPSTPLDVDERDAVDGQGDLDGRGTPPLPRDTGMSSSDEDEEEVNSNPHAVNLMLTTPQVADEMHTPQNDSDEEEHIIVTRPEDVIDPEEEAEFEREFAKMMSESVESRRADKRPINEISLPNRRGNQEAGADGVEKGDAPTAKFSLLSKKGNRPQVCSMRNPPCIPGYLLALELRSFIRQD